MGPGTLSTYAVEINMPGERIATFDNEGTAYPEDVSLEANAKNLKVSVQNPGYQRGAT